MEDEIFIFVLRFLNLLETANHKPRHNFIATVRQQIIKTNT
jgi:hypothetical protein